MAKYVSYEDFSRICRLCFEEDNLKPIYSIPEFLKKIKIITNIKVPPADKLPKNVCTACVDKIDYIHCFIETCRNNDAILKTILLQEEDRSIEAKLRPEKVTTEEEIQVKVENNERNNEEDLMTVKIIKDESKTNDNIEEEKELNKERKEKIFRCGKCSKVFPSLVFLRSHAKRHTRINKPMKKRNDECKCIYCNKYFTRKSDLQRHLRIHTGAKLFSCNLCNKKFTQKNSLERHNLLHTGKFSCAICNKPFTRKSYLENHTKTHSLVSKNTKFKNRSNSLKCRFCGITFSSARYLQGHIRVHTGESDFKCDICDKLFPLKASLERHHLAHTQIKEFKCDKCDAAFNRNTLLEKHKKYHDEDSEEKHRLTCMECGKYFLFPSHLRRHAAVHDINQKPVAYKPTSKPKQLDQFLCSYCGKKFTQACNLSVHIRTHTGERFKCEICDNTYSTKSSLKIHLMAHRGEKPYPCPHCGKQFRKPSLYKHLLIHKDIRKFKCEVCLKTFIRKDQLDQHQKNHM